jgi:hypothetical protein
MRSPKELVGTASAKSKCNNKNWYERLSPSDMKYVDEVAKLAIKNGAPINSVAKELIVELSISVSPQTVAKHIYGSMKNEK